MDASAERMKRAWRRARRRAFEVPLNIHPARALRAVRSLRRDHPDETVEELARRIVRRRMLTPAAIGFVTGAPASPWTAGVLAAADVGFAIRHHVETACQIAALYDSHFFEGENAHWEVLVPVLGATQEGRALGEARKEPEAVSQAVRQKIVGRMRRAAIRSLGATLLKKALLAKALPMLGGVIGGAWGLHDAWRIGDQILDYFAARHQQIRARLDHL